MARVQKISAKQFVLDCINKEFEIIESSIHFDTFEDLEVWSKLKENECWYHNYTFTSAAQYNEWKEYFFTHFYDWKPKRIKLYRVEREFSWFNLMYGFRCDFDTSEL